MAVVALKQVVGTGVPRVYGTKNVWSDTDKTLGRNMKQEGKRTFNTDL